MNPWRTSHPTGPSSRSTASRSAARLAQALLLAAGALWAGCSPDLGAQARAALEGGDLEQAVALYARLNGPGASEEVVRGHALALARSARYKEAADVLGALPAAPSEPELVIALARAQILRGELAAGTHTIEGVVAAQPSLALAHAALADAHARAGQLEQARARFQKALQLDPNLAAAHVGLGDLALTEGDRVAAAAAYEQAIAVGGGGPDGVLARARQARMLAAQGKSREAQGRIQEAMALQPDHPAVRAELGKLMVQMGYFSQALGLLQEAQADLGADPELTSYIGFVLLQRARMQMTEPEVLRDLHAARVWLEKTVALDPGREEAWNNLGQVRAALSDTEGAEAAFVAASQVAPRSVEGLLNLGQLYAGEGQADKARLTFEKALAVAPGHVVAQMNLGVLALREGNLDLAEQHYASAASQCGGTAPDHPCRAELAYNQARIASRRGKIDEGAGLLQQAMAAGFRDLGRLMAEPDLAALRADIRVASAIDAMRLSALAPGGGGQLPQLPPEMD